MSFTALNTGGSYQHKLSVNEMPSHKHFVLDQTTDSPSGISGQVEGVGSYLSRVTNRADPKLRYWWSTTCSTGAETHIALCNLGFLFIFGNGLNNYCVLRQKNVTI